MDDAQTKVKPLCLINQMLDDTPPVSGPEPFPVSVIKEEFECSACNMKFPCLKELESHSTYHFGQYINYSDGKAPMITLTHRLTIQE